MVIMSRAWMMIERKEIEKEPRMLKWKFPEYFQQHPSSRDDDGMLESYMIYKWQFHH